MSQRRTRKEALAALRASGHLPKRSWLPTQLRVARHLYTTRTRPAILCGDCWRLRLRRWPSRLITEPLRHG